MIDNNLEGLIEAIKDEKQTKRDIDQIKKELKEIKKTLDYLDKADDAYTDTICKLHIKMNDIRDKTLWWNVSLCIVHVIFLIAVLIKNFVL